MDNQAADRLHTRLMGIESVLKEIVIALNKIAANQNPPEKRRTTA